MSEASSDAPGHEPRFDDRFVATFDELLRWRRDVRRFRTEPLGDGLLATIVGAAELAPSVGNSQPWRWVEVRSPDRREAVADNFRRCNAEALAGYRGDRAEHYAGLKLAGLREAPVQLAVFSEPEVAQGHGLGRRTMPEMLEYSVVTAVSNLWLAARARGIGVGWVSIVDPVEVAETLDVPAHWRLVAYLCIGYPEREADRPELERVGWQARTDPSGRYSVR